MYFQVVDPLRAQYVGGYTANAAGEIQNGLLVKSDTSNKLTLAGISDKPDGFAYSNRTNVYTPTVLTLDAGEACTVIQGHVLAYVDGSAFYGGTIPAVNAPVYTYTGGLMHTSGSVNIGKVLKISDYRSAPNGTTNIALVSVVLGGKDSV